MSLRWRLTLYSTVILGLVFAIFGTVAYFAVGAILYVPIDENLLPEQSKSNLIYMQRIPMNTQGVRANLVPAPSTRSRRGTLSPKPPISRSIRPCSRPRLLGRRYGR